MNCVVRNSEIISREQRALISERYKRVTRAVNRAFWDSDSETAHSRYVGSYGRGTAIDTSDIDILIALPRAKYEQYDSRKGNGQSQLLQALKDAILLTYPRSEVKADGQVVDIFFSDGMKFEILPAFQQLDWLGDWNGKYNYPDSNMGGNWLTTDPMAEQQAMKQKNEESNGLLFDTCQHMRQIRDNYFSSYHLSGIVIDSYVYHHIGGWHWTRPGEESSVRGTYEMKLYSECPLFALNLSAPGSGMPVNMSGSIECLRKVLNHMSKE